MNETRLAKLFQFDQEDLQANRRGDLSDKQLQRYVKGISSDWRFTRLTGFMMVGVGILPALLFGFSGRLLPVELLLVWGIWPLGWAILGYQWLRRSYAPKDYSVTRLQGKLEFVEEKVLNPDNRHYSTRAAVRIAGKEIDVIGDIGHWIVQGDDYAVYYVENLGEIVSLERAAAQK